MIKIDYEGAWKELRREYGIKSIHQLTIENKVETYLIANLMEDLEQKHTHNNGSLSKADPNDDDNILGRK